MNNINRVNPPAFTGTRVVARHAPAKSCASEAGRQSHDRTHKAVRITTPSLTTCNRTATISADRPIIPTRDEAAARGKNVLKGISTISAHLQHASIESDIWVHVGSFEIEILLESQLNRRGGKL
jgi:hypothetical protein